MGRVRVVFHRVHLRGCEGTHPTDRRAESGRRAEASTRLTRGTHKWMLVARRVPKCVCACGACAVCFIAPVCVSLGRSPSRWCWANSWCSVRPLATEDSSAVLRRDIVPPRVGSWAHLAVASFVRSFFCRGWSLPVGCSVAAVATAETSKALTPQRTLRDDAHAAQACRERGEEKREKESYRDETACGSALSRRMISTWPSTFTDRLRPSGL